MTEATHQHLPLTALEPHPDNPRLFLRDEVIGGIAAQVQARGFAVEYSLLVRPLGVGRYQVVAGHHRLEAARQAGLTDVPCWVRQMTDDEAYMELALGNNQDQLEPLEMGLHALGTLERGGDVGDYARMVGRSRRHIGRLLNAARVFDYLVSQAVEKGGTSCPTFFLSYIEPILMEQLGVSALNLLRRSMHLHEIHRAPEAVWVQLVEEMMAHNWTAAEVRDYASQARRLAGWEPEGYDRCVQPQVARRPPQLPPETVAAIEANRAQYDGSRSYYYSEVLYGIMIPKTDYSWRMP